jgi:hypothetical protein
MMPEVKEDLLAIGQEHQFKLLHNLTSTPAHNISHDKEVNINIPLSQTSSNQPSAACKNFHPVKY